ncbi:MAG TPA: fatty acid desaturase [Acidimicrobiales bacterium]|nr:fatty acid desaturase [Acidimicrobiales bacterium]
MPHIALAVIAGLAVCQLAILLTTVYLHRTISHKALTMVPWLRFVCRLLLWITTGVRPRQWAAVHRKHHAFTDVEGDPHSPVLLGFKRVQIANVVLYRATIRDGVTVEKYAKDLPPDKWDKYLFDHALIGLAIGIGILCLLLGWEWGLIAAAIHTVSYLMLNSAVNAVGHTFGKRPYPNKARNNMWLALVTAGEGWHNNHHALPTSARLGLKGSQIDFGWWFIRVCAWRKWATIRLSDEALKAKVPVAAS